jgi:MinD-like ATPase involved in chromosome partitioning or flagellar assembly
MRSTGSAPIRQETAAQKPSPAPGDSAEKVGAARQAQVIAISSGKGGVGKTCISTNLSIALASRGKRVCLFDADTSLANVNILLALAPRHTLEHYLKGECRIDELLIRAPGGLKIVPGATGIGEFVDLSPDQQAHLVEGLKQLESRFDYLFIDTAAGISDPLIQFLLAAPYLILTITQEPTSLTDAFSLLKVLKRHGFSAPVLVIINMAQGLSSAHETFHRFKGAVAKYLGIDVHYLSFIFSDPRVSDSIRAQKPFIQTYPESLASRCINTTGDRLLKVMERKSGKHSFSRYFENLHLESDRQIVQTQPPTAAAAVPEDRENLEQLLSGAERLPRQQRELFLLDATAAYSRSYPELSAELLAALQSRLSGATPREEVLQDAIPPTPTCNEELPPPREAGIETTGVNDSEMTALWTGCQFAARLHRP